MSKHSRRSRAPTPAGSSACTTRSTFSISSKGTPSESTISSIGVITQPRSSSEPTRNSAMRMDSLGRFRKCSCSSRLSASVVRVTGTFSRNSMLVSLCGTNVRSSEPSCRYSDQSIGSSSAGSSDSSLFCSSAEASLSMSSCSVTSSTSSSSGFCSTSCFKICCSSSVGTCSSLSACCRRGVMMSFCVWDRWSECFISIASAPRG